MNEWNDEQVVTEYAKKATTTQSGWYEYEVNFPDMARLFPDNVSSVLDFGCGPAEFTHELNKLYGNVTGVDMMPMLEIARTNRPEIKFIEWNGLSSIPEELGHYDVIFSKLVIQFIDDLDVLASNFRSILKEGGAAVLSIPNPTRIARKFSLSPTEKAFYDDVVGETGIKIHPIYRPLEHYVSAFNKAGLVLVETSEPEIPNTIAKKHNLTPKQASDTKRMNLLFKIQ